MAASKAPSLLEYARYHGLATAHRTRDLLSGVSAASERDVTTKDDDHLPAFTLPISKDFYHEPQLQLNAAGRILLSHSIRPPDLPSWDRFLPDHHRVQKLKFEEVLIPGDCDQNTWDCVVRQSLDLARQAVQPEIMVEDSDAALGFPPELLQLAEQWDAEIAQERLQTKKEVLGRLWNTLQDDFPPELYESIAAESLQQLKRQAIHEITSPPLVPREDLSLPSSQCPSSLDLSVTSTGDYVNTQHVAEAIRNSAKENCATVTAASGSNHSRSPQISTEVQHAQNVASETFAPILEASMQPPPDKKTVAFADILEEYIPGVVEVNGNLDILNDFVKTNVPESAPQRHVEIVKNEIPVASRKPLEATIRIRIPDLEAVAPVLPWPSNDTGRDDLLGSIVRELAVDPEADQEQSPDQQVGWVPFPLHWAEIDIEETIGAGAKLQNFVCSPQEIVQSSQLLWKPAGLSILDDDDGSEGDELLEDARLVAESQEQPQVPRKRLLDTRPLEYPRKLPRVPFNESSNVSTKAFSASGSLSTFMGSRDRLSEQLKQAVSYRFPPRKQEVDSTPNEVAGSLRQVPATPNVELDNFSHPTVPEGINTDRPRTIILNTTLLSSQRSLVRHVEKVFGQNLTIVYRDLAEDCGQGQISTAPDILLSPTKTLVYTSLQASVQRPLPGQGLGLSPVHEKILRLAEIFDEVYVLVSQPFPKSHVEANTCTAISAFAAFAAFLGTTSEVRPIFVDLAYQAPDTLQSRGREMPGTRGMAPTEVNLTRAWTVSLVAKHAFPSSPDVPLMQDETLWERFLQTAGLNAFAAQVVLGVLKRSSDDGAGKSWGLPAFLHMSERERNTTFGPVLGTKAVARVGANLDTSWERM